MAKLKFGTGITGTVENLLFYKVGNAYYLRKASSLTGDRVKKDKAFRKTMEESRLLAKASMLASALYQSLPKHKRDHALFHALVGFCRKGVKLGLTPTRIRVMVKKDFPVFRYLRSVRKQASSRELTRYLPLQPATEVA